MSMIDTSSLYEHRPGIMQCRGCYATCCEDKGIEGISHTTACPVGLLEEL